MLGYLFHEPSQEIVHCSGSDPDQLTTVHHYRQKARYISNIRKLHFSNTGYGHLLRREELIFGCIFPWLICVTCSQI